MTPPTLITVEGPDGCGKSTVVPLLVRVLSETTGEAWTHIADPTPGPTTDIIRKILSFGRHSGIKALFYLFMAERILDFPDEVEAPLLVSDRGLLSTWVYQHELCEDPRRREIVRLALEQETLLRRPAVTTVLLPPVEVCVKRAAQRQVRHLETFDKAEIIRRTWGLYHRAAFDSSTPSCVTGVVLPIRLRGTESPEYVAGCILGALYHHEILPSRLKTT